MQFIGLDCILMILLTMVDQWTKSLVVHHLKGQSDVILIPGVFQLHYLENRGLLLEFCRISVRSLWY